MGHHWYDSVCFSEAMVTNVAVWGGGGGERSTTQSVFSNVYYLQQSDRSVMPLLPNYGPIPRHHHTLTQSHMYTLSYHTFYIESLLVVVP